MELHTVLNITLKYYNWWLWEKQVLTSPCGPALSSCSQFLSPLLNPLYHYLGFVRRLWLPDKLQLAFHCMRKITWCRETGPAASWDMGWKGGENEATLSSPWARLDCKQIQSFFLTHNHGFWAANRPLCLPISLLRDVYWPMQAVDSATPVEHCHDSNSPVLEHLNDPIFLVKKQFCKTEYIWVMEELTRTQWFCLQIRADLVDHV